MTLIVKVVPPSAVIVNEFDTGLLATVPRTGLLRPPLGRMAISVAVAVVPERLPNTATFALRTTFVSDAVNMLPTNTIATDGSLTTESGTAITATDDYYKRTLTWCTYIGDGRVFNFPNLRKRVARFLYGVNGTDITLSQAQNVALAVGSNPNDVTITVPAGTSSTYFSDALASGTLPFPFMLLPTVVIS